MNFLPTSTSMSWGYDDIAEQDMLTYNKRSAPKWQKDELLNDASTIPPVLYANLTQPKLKIEFPGRARLSNVNVIGMCDLERGVGRSGLILSMILWGD